MRPKPQLGRTASSRCDTGLRPAGPSRPPAFAPRPAARSPGSAPKTGAATCSFSCSSRLQVAYTSRPPGLSRRDALCRIDSLQRRHLRNAVRALAPFQVRIAAQGSQARTRRVDQHPVDLAGQPLDAIVALMADRHRMHVGQPAARQPGFERIEPVRRRVERIQTAGAAHRRAQRQRLAAGAGTEVDHHLAAMGIDQQRQKLRALVLHLEIAPHKGVELGSDWACRPPAAPTANTASDCARTPWRASSFTTSSRLALNGLTRRSSVPGSARLLGQWPEIRSRLPS